MKTLSRYMITIVMVIMIAIPLQAKANDVWLIWGDELKNLEEGNIFEHQGLTYIPLREIGMLFDATIKWDLETDNIHIKGRDKKVVINTKESTYTIEEMGSTKTQAIQLIEKNQRTYIPLRIFADLFDTTINYVPKGPFVRIYTEHAVLSDEEIYEKYRTAMSIPKEVMYLTFDDGPNAYTDDLLDILAEYDMKATFFMLEGNMKKYPNLVKRMVDEGHGVALHGVTHDKNLFYNGSYGPYNELEKGNKTLEQITGVRTKVVRMPYGSVPYLTNSQLQILNQSGYEIWDWHVDSRDWANRDGQLTYAQVINHLEQTKVEEPVVLFHDSKYTVDTVKKLMKWMDENDKTSKALTDEMNGLSFKEKNLY